MMIKQTVNSMKKKAGLDVMQNHPVQLYNKNKTLTQGGGLRGAGAKTKVGGHAPLCVLNMQDVDLLSSAQIN